MVQIRNVVAAVAIVVLIGGGATAQTVPGFVYDPADEIGISGFVHGRSSASGFAGGGLVLCEDPEEEDIDAAVPLSDENCVVPVGPVIWSNCEAPDAEAQDTNFQTFALTAYRRVVCFDGGAMDSCELQALGASGAGTWGSSEVGVSFLFSVNESGHLLIQRADLILEDLVALPPEAEDEGRASGATFEWIVEGAGVDPLVASDAFSTCHPWTPNGQACDKMFDQRPLGKARSTPIAPGLYTFHGLFQAHSSTYLDSPVGWFGELAHAGGLTRYHFDVTLRYLRYPFTLGDLNDDGVVDADDIPLFNDALRNSEGGFDNAHPDGIYAAGDFDGNGRVSPDDLPGFIDALPPNTPLTGACCVGPTCYADQTLAACSSLDGVLYLGEPCNTGTCVLPPGACCVSGECDVFSEADCSAADGVYHGNGTVCQPYECENSEAGACCYPGGSCMVTTHFGCSGTWLGASTSCGGDPCPQPGACCFTDGRCEMSGTVSPGNCAGGATYLGDDTTCAPNPCPQPTGACCHLSNCSVVTEADCLALAGEWHGTDSECTDTLCLCLGDMNCDGYVNFSDINPFVTAVVSRSSYESQYPDCQYLNGDLDCNGFVNFNDMNPFVAQVVLGTCGVPCWQEGACCFADGSCAVMARADCLQQAGRFHGANTKCDPNPCPQAGACCAANGTTCTDEMLEYDCVHAGKHFLGEGTVCESNQCPQAGACCDSSGACTWQVAEWKCAEYGGYFMGEYTTCNQVSCPQPGACCYDAESCEEIAAWACDLNGGTFMGASTTCDPNPCE